MKMIFLTVTKVSWVDVNYKIGNVAGAGAVEIPVSVGHLTFDDGQNLGGFKKVLTESDFCDILIKLSRKSVGKLDFEVWLSLVERFVRDEEAAGSNPVTSTTSFKSNNNISRCGSAW